MWPQGSNEQTQKHDKHKTTITQMIHKIGHLVILNAVHDIEDYRYYLKKVIYSDQLF